MGLKCILWDVDGTGKEAIPGDVQGLAARGTVVRFTQRRKQIGGGLRQVKRFWVCVKREARGEARAGMYFGKWRSTWTGSGIL